MTFDEQKQTIDSFHELISKTAKYQILKNEKAISGVMVNYLNSKENLTPDERDIIVNTVCMDYMDNFNEVDKPSSIYEVLKKFDDDEKFANKVLCIYLDKYFYNDITINNFNNLIVNYGEESNANEENISSIIYRIITMTSYFSADDKKLVIKHMFEECRKDISNRKKAGEVIDYDEDINICLQQTYSDEVYNNLINDQMLLSQLIYCYFNAFILEDFQFKKIDVLYESMISDRKRGPNDLELANIYDSIIGLDDLYDYKEPILNMVDIVERLDVDLKELYKAYLYSDDDYSLFVKDSSYGKKIIKKYFEMTMLDNEEQRVELISSVVRDSLKSLVSPERTIDENVACLYRYFEGAKSSGNWVYPRYLIKSEDLLLCQKVCLISDYYNRFSDKSSNCLITSHISFIENNDLSLIVGYFDNDSCFSKFCLECYVEQTLGIHYENNGICKNEDILKKINPFYVFERASNEAYQKKKNS